MKFAYLEEIDDSRPCTERLLVDTINRHIRPMGWKVSAMMDEPQVTAFIAGTNAILDRTIGDIKLNPKTPEETAREVVRHLRRQCPMRIVRNQQEKAEDRRQHILVTIAVILAFVALTILNRCLK